MNNSRLSRTPEIEICFLSFFLNFFWEVVQTYFYTMKNAPFNTMLYGWVHCTLGDVILTMASFWIVSIISHERKWLLHPSPLNFIAFVMIGVVVTVISERVNVHIFKSWTYNELMPLIPLMKVGLTPFLQWIIVPATVILLVRHHLLLRQELEEIKGGSVMKRSWLMLMTFIVLEIVITTLAVPQAPIKRISIDELKNMLNNPDLTIIDVRIENDWENSNMKIKGAAREDYMRVETWADKYPKDKLIVVYCA